MSIKRLENLLNPNNDGGLGDIIRHAQDMGELVQCLQQQLPDDTAANILAANVRDNGELVVLASSPAWAAKHRVHEDALMTAARQSGAQVTSCRVRVSRG
jgi:hypothetical protein